MKLSVVVLIIAASFTLLLKEEISQVEQVADLLEHANYFLHPVYSPFFKVISPYSTQLLETISPLTSRIHEASAPLRAAMFPPTVVNVFKNGFDDGKVEYRVENRDFEILKQELAIALYPEGDFTSVRVYDEVGEIINSARGLRNGMDVYVAVNDELYMLPGKYIGYSRMVGGFNVTTISLLPRAFSISNFISDAECDNIVTQANRSMERSKTYSAGVQVHSGRTSATGYVHYPNYILEKTYNLTKMPHDDSYFYPDHQLQVIHYGPNQFFHPHHDAHHPGEAVMKEDWYQKGARNRYLTLFLYLNDVEEGGETAFISKQASDEFQKNIDKYTVHENNPCDTSVVKMNPKKGHGVLFYNLAAGRAHEDPAVIETTSLHTGCGVKKGEKWACNVWMWNRPTTNPQYLEWMKMSGLKPVSDATPKKAAPQGQAQASTKTSDNVDQKGAIDGEDVAQRHYSTSIRYGLRALQNNDSSLLQNALQSIDQALVLQPRFTGAHIVRALIHLIQGQYTLARDGLENVCNSSWSGSLKHETTALLGYTQDLLQNTSGTAYLFQPLFWKDNKSKVLPTTTLLVDNYHFRPSWQHVNDYSNYRSHFAKLLAFHKLYERLPSSNWDIPNEFSWPKYPVDATHDDQLYAAAMAESVPLRAVLRGGPNVGINGGNMSEARRILAESEVVHLRGVLQPFETKLIWDYYSEIISVGRAEYDSYLHRYIVNNDRIGYYLLYKFKEFAEALAGEPLKPSYMFLSYYKNPSLANDQSNKANLRPHTDKADNYITFSFQLKINNVAGEEREGAAWPLWVHKPKTADKAQWHERPPIDESVSFNLLEGDVLAFKGRTHIHWRDAMPPTMQNCTTFLLHYIPVDFDYEGFVTRGR